MIIFVKKPKIIGVTGTAWKTTVSKFVAQFLGASYSKEDIGYSQYNYNWEFGLPLTIIWAKSGWKNILLWVWIFFVALGRLFQKYPKILVLEYGIDHPNEMDFLLSIAIPDIAIITPIVANHIQQFKTEEAYIAEKLKITISKNIIVHETVAPKIEHNNMIVFGTNSVCDIYLKNIYNSIGGLEGEVLYRQKLFNFRLSAFWEYQGENVLPLYYIADYFDIPFDTIGGIICGLKLESWRSQMLDGYKNSIIIDGTYNGGFLSIVEWLRSLVPFSSEYRIIIFLGDMRELWVEEQKKHEELSQKIIDFFGNKKENIEIVLIWNMTRKYMFDRLKNFSVQSFLSSIEGWKYIKKSIEASQKKVLLYAKWSQNTIFLEEGLKEIILPSQHYLLPRQSRDWLQKKNLFFATLKE